MKLARKSCQRNRESNSAYTARIAVFHSVLCLSHVQEIVSLSTLYVPGIEMNSFAMEIDVMRFQLKRVTLAADQSKSINHAASTMISCTIVSTRSSKSLAARYCQFNRRDDSLNDWIE